MAFRLRLSFLFFAPLLLFACTSSSASEDTGLAATPSATAAAARPVATPTTAPAPAASARLEPNGQRILALVDQLATGIGPRIAGTSTEKQAADLIAGLLRGHGYEVEVTPLTVSREVSRESRVALTAPGRREVPSVPLSSSIAAAATGLLVPGGIGRPEQIPASARGAIVLIERGELTFQDKVVNAQAAGAVGIIIYNNQAGTFFGTLSSASAIPAVAVSQAEGEALLAVAAARVEISVGETPITSSHNVIARPPGKQCETITGGHFDSVPGSPGANDNASGTATVVEIAAVLASQGKMGSNCFALFGAEEIGLVGSRAFVESLGPVDRQRLKAMLNFDMVGFGTEPWYLIGSPALQTRAASVASSLGIATQTRNLASTGGGSDHASFINAGIPAIFFYHASDPQWHQPGDTADHLNPALLEEAARMGVAMLEALAGGG